MKLTGPAADWMTGRDEKAEWLIETWETVAAGSELNARLGAIVDHLRINGLGGEKGSMLFFLR